jgi:tetratricopeptide (TPR) repeat protein
VAYEETGAGALAEGELRQTIRLDPGFAEAYNYLGYMFAEEGRNLDEAVELLNKAVSLEPDNGAYIDSLGWAYYKKGMYKEAFELLEKALRLEPNEPEIAEHLKKAQEKVKSQK